MKYIKFKLVDQNENRLLKKFYSSFCSINMNEEKKKDGLGMKRGSYYKLY